MTWVFSVVLFFFFSFFSSVSFSGPTPCFSNSSGIRVFIESEKCDYERIFTTAGWKDIYQVNAGPFIDIECRITDCLQRECLLVECYEPREWRKPHANMAKEEVSMERACSENLPKIVEKLIKQYSRDLFVPK